MGVIAQDSRQSLQRALHSFYRRWEVHHGHRRFIYNSRGDATFLWVGDGQPTPSFWKGSPRCPADPQSASDTSVLAFPPRHPLCFTRSWVRQLSPRHRCPSRLATTTVRPSLASTSSSCSETTPWPGAETGRAIRTCNCCWSSQAKNITWVLWIGGILQGVIRIQQNVQICSNDRFVWLIDQWSCEFKEFFMMSSAYSKMWKYAQIQKNVSTLPYQ